MAGIARTFRLHSKSQLILNIESLDGDEKISYVALAAHGRFIYIR